MSIYQSNICGKDLIRLHFHEDPRFKDMQQMQNQQSYITFSVTCLGYPSSTLEHQPRRDNGISCTALWWIYRLGEKETSQNESKLQFLWKQFLQWRRCKPQSNLKEKDSPSILKDDFPQEQIHQFSHQQHQSHQSFFSIEINKPFQMPNQTKQRVVSSAQIAILCIISSGRPLCTVGKVYDQDWRSKNTSISWIFTRFIQSYSKLSTSEKRRSTAKYLTSSSVRLKVVKKTSMPNPVENFRYIKRYRSISLRSIKSLRWSFY